MERHLAPDSSADRRVVGPPSAGIHQEVGEGETILFLEPQDSVITLNETGTAVWTLCDGTQTVDEIVQELATAYQVDSDDIAGEVSALITQLGSAGFLPGNRRQP